MKPVFVMTMVAVAPESALPVKRIVVSGTPAANADPFPRHLAFLP